MKAFLSGLSNNVIKKYAIQKKKKTNTMELISKTLRSFENSAKHMLNAAIGELWKSEKEENVLKLSTVEFVVITELIDTV